MPRFVVLEHTWNGVHWDMMFETGDRLRTWAIDAPIVPGIELPARALADHRLEYLHYEGDVSGARGSVRRIDQGEYAALLWEEDRVRVKLAGAQLVGEAELWLTSRRLSCGSALSWTFRLGNFD
jgi:hypothetical protein